MNYSRRLRNKEYRDAVVEAAIGNTIAAQLQGLRKKNDLSQVQLAQRAQMAQPRIAVLENPDYDNYTVKTLKRLAAALDVGLIVRFAPYGEVMDWVTGFSPNSIYVPTFDEELEEGQKITGNSNFEIKMNLVGEAPAPEDAKMAAVSANSDLPFSLV